MGRELTKQFEEIATVPCAGFGDWLLASPHRSKGEFALVLHPIVREAMPAEGGGLSPETLRVLSLLLKELPVKTAARLCADITAQPKNALYTAALALKANPDGNA